MWKDATTYSQRDTERVPAVWHYGVGDVRISVHRHIHYAPDQWLLTCEPFFSKRELKAKDTGGAKAEALAMVCQKVKELAEALAV